MSLQVDRLRSVAEVSLIFFYAPWCAHSMAARQELQQVARKLAKQVQRSTWRHNELSLLFLQYCTSVLLPPSQKKAEKPCGYVKQVYQVIRVLITIQQSEYIFILYKT